MAFRLRSSVPFGTESRMAFFSDSSLTTCVAATHVVTETALEKAILDSVPKGTEVLNQKAMKMGFELAGAAPGGQKA